MAKKRRMKSWTVSFVLVDQPDILSNEEFITEKDILRYIEGMNLDVGVEMVKLKIQEL